jgi:hypothetical protein
MTCFIQLGKTGDIISILPMMMLQYQRTGSAFLMVCKEFAPLLEGVSYVNPVMWKGDVTDVRGAIAEAKKKFGHVVRLQTHGNIPVVTTAPSFQFDQYARFGMLKDFDKLPLVFDNRSPSRELDLTLSLSDQPVILFADHSQSSPFLQKEELAKMLKDEFPGYQIVRLSEVRSERFYDLLGLYDKAKCLITVETAHLHLSKGSKVPTLAIAANGWRGSAYSNRFRFFMRYPEWNSRKQTLLRHVRKVVEGLPDGPICKSFARGNQGYNYSGIEYAGMTVTAYREHTRGDWRTEIFCNDTKLNVIPALKDFSIEDMRLFIYQDRLWGAYVVSTALGNSFRSYMAYGKIEGESISHIRIFRPGNDHSTLEKNWVPFVHENRLFFIYGIRGTDQITIEVSGDKVLGEHKAGAPVWPHGEIRGGVVVSHQGQLLRFFHSRVAYSDKTQRYFIGCSVLENKPPFRTLKVSRVPILEGTEEFVSGAKFWKPSVVFPLGAISSGDGIYLYHGKNDCQCCVAYLKYEDLNL